MQGTQQNWNLVWNGVLTTTTANPGPGGFSIDPRIGAATTRAPASSNEDYRPQAILKFHYPSGLDYRACHRLSFENDNLFVRSPTLLSGELQLKWGKAEQSIINPKNLK